MQGRIYVLVYPALQSIGYGVCTALVSLHSIAVQYTTPQTYLEASTCGIPASAGNAWPEMLAEAGRGWPVSQQLG